MLFHIALLNHAVGQYVVGVRYNFYPTRSLHVTHTYIRVHIGHLLQSKFCFEVGQKSREKSWLLSQGLSITILGHCDRLLCLFETRYDALLENLNARRAERDRMSQHLARYKDESSSVRRALRGDRIGSTHRRVVCLTGVEQGHRRRILLHTMASAGFSA